MRRYSRLPSAKRYEGDGKADSSGSHRAGGVRLGDGSRASGSGPRAALLSRGGAAAGEAREGETDRPERKQAQKR